jgi:hypothetical protein
MIADDRDNFRHWMQDAVRSYQFQFAGIMLFCCQLLCITRATAQDRLVFKNGDISSGVVVERFADRVLFRGELTGVLTYDTKDIQRIELGSKDAILKFRNDIKKYPGTSIVPGSPKVS